MSSHDLTPNHNPNTETNEDHRSHRHHSGSGHWSHHPNSHRPNYRGRNRGWQWPRRPNPNHSRPSAGAHSASNDWSDSSAQVRPDQNRSANTNNESEDTAGASYVRPQPQHSRQTRSRPPRQPTHVRNVNNESETQREIMEESLRKGEFECIVCCDPIRVRDRVYNCEHCYNVCHLKCIKEWAQTQMTGDQSWWRCPTCQTHVHRVPNRYVCFCGKQREPDLNHFIVPHSCGNTCGRKRRSDPTRRHNCDHKCLLRCHPGSCPPCEQTVSRQCGCGRTQVRVKCLTNDAVLGCGQTCNKPLNCRRHLCQRVCHYEPCLSCDQTKCQKCFCGQSERQVECNVQNNVTDSYGCGQVCNKPLDCQNHKCERLCHSGPCLPCALVPEAVTHCPCGKTPLNQLSPKQRKSCLEPIANCDQICDKELFCGPDKEHHRCQSRCHSGDCPPCDLKTAIKCRCGQNHESVDCAQLIPGYVLICQMRCKRKRNCGRHKCIQVCCVDDQHVCAEKCDKRLSCGQHRCPEDCHSGVCPACYNVSWDELSCRCGREVLLPPIACGTKPPECSAQCSRPHPCDHPVDHNCHDDPECPPCTYFAVKSCYGGHQRRNIPCHESGYSCANLCGRPLDCGLHECRQVCHWGECNPCRMPCTKVREACGHLCALECHQKTSGDVCPKSSCKSMVEVFCECGRKTERMMCHKVNDTTAVRISFNALANQRIKNGESVDVSDLMKNMQSLRLIQLKCDDKCAVVERNRQLAQALDIREANLDPKPGPPRYSDFLKNSSLTEPTFLRDMYDQLSKLVIAAKQSKLPFQTLYLPAMNCENRRIVHELAEHFGCKTSAIDREPNRSVVVKALQDKCYLPTVSPFDVKEESPSNRSTKITLKSHSFDTGPDIASLTTTGLTAAVAKNSSEVQNKSNSQVIDYFDFKGD